MNSLSIIVPTWNEEDTIHPLVERIHAALSSQNITYEIIFVDDHSTDKTQAKIKSAGKKFPVILQFKKR